MKLSTNFTLDEMTRSQTATRHGIPNDPTDEEIRNLADLCEQILERVRAYFGAPVLISSGYRSKALNLRIGGSVNSQHCRGEAADFTVAGRSVREVFDYIRTSALPFDQVIDEFGGWVHVSHTRGRGNRRESLRATRVNGRAYYSRIN